LQNALERGDNLEKAKQSFINSGYTSEEVETATAKLSQSPESQSTPQPEVAVPSPQSAPVTQPLPAQPQVKQPPKQASKTFLIILVIISILILGVAGAVGLFWDKIFG